MYDKDQHIAQLEAVNLALTEQLTALNKRKMARNDEAARKWRAQAFYYKQKCARLLEAAKQNGLECPKQGGDDESSS
jgi:hypothetical protein